MHSPFLKQPLDRTAHRPQPASLAVPFHHWPIWAKAIYRLRGPSDTGIGDTIKRVLGTQRSEKFKTWYKKKFGKDCGCGNRQKEWNHKYPYTPHPAAHPAPTAPPTREPSAPSPPVTKN